MNAKSTIRKVLFISLWVCIGGAMLTLLLAAIGKKNKGLCKDYSVSIKAPNNNFFIDEKDVASLLIKATGGKIKGQSVSAFDLHKLEKMLEQNTWISDAELYFDSRDVLHVAVNEKEPVGRIFTTGGHSFYIDQSGNKMPLSDKISARVPVFTDFPEVKKSDVKDSILLEQVTATAIFINENPFWSAQVAQVDIADDGSLEMIPLVGDQVIRLGKGENIAQKFHRLYIFYQQVLSKTGFEKFKTIDVQFDGQVVASRQADNIKVDKAAYKKNVEKLIKESTETANEIMPPAPVVTGKYNLSTDSATAPVPELKEIEDVNKPAKKTENKASDPNPLKSSSSKKEEMKKEVKPKVKEEKRIPKAVMPKRMPDEEENGGYN